MNILNSENVHRKHRLKNIYLRQLTYLTSCHQFDSRLVQRYDFI